MPTCHLPDLDHAALPQRHLLEGDQVRPDQLGRVIDLEAATE
jgi:hypothetical protein